MRSRQEIVEIFSTFLQFEAGKFHKWAKDGTLYQNMRRSLNDVLSPSPSAADWGLYWHKIWLHQPKSLARRHLYAYLQEACYNAAKKINARFTLPQYTLPDYCQIGIASIDKVLTSFNPTRSSNLVAYATYKLANLIKDGLVKEGLAEASIRSDWSFLQHTSEKRVRKALHRGGVAKEKIGCYIFAWECFNTVYQPQKPRGNRQLDAPDASTWEAIVQLYNSDRLAQLSAIAPICDVATMQQWMQTCIKALRAFLAPATISLNAPISEQGHTLEDNLPSSDLTALEKLLDAEEDLYRSSLWKQVNSLFSNAITQVDAQTQELFVLAYGEGLTQKEIAQKLQISQPTVSRRLSKLNKFKREWLVLLGEWTASTLNISPTPDVINSMGELLEEWLQQHYGNAAQLKGNDYDNGF